MPDYTAAVLDLVNTALADQIPGSPPMTTTTDHHGTWNTAALGDGTTLVASTAEYTNVWNTDTEPALRLDLFTDSAWADRHPPFSRVVTHAVTSPAAVTQALKDVGISYPQWLNRWYRTSMTTLAATYVPEIAALAAIGLTAYPEDTSRGMYSLVVDIDPDNDDCLYIGTDNEDSPGLPVTADNRARLTGWSIYRVRCGVLVDVHGDEVPYERDAPRPITTDATAEGLARLAVATGHGPNVDTPPSDSSWPMTISQVAAAVIADIITQTPSEPRFATAASFDDLHDLTDANMLGDAAIAAYEQHTGHKWADYAPLVQDLVSGWLSAHARREAS